MSKKSARRMLQDLKHGTTVKEFLSFCSDMGNWFDDVQGTELEEIYYALTGEEN